MLYPSNTPRRLGEEKEEAEEDKEINLLKATNYKCESCGSTIRVSEEFFILLFVYLLQHNDITEHIEIQHPQVAEPVGPLYFCYECIEEEGTKIEELYEDAPPQLIHFPDIVTTCDFCGDNILEGEAIGYLRQGAVYYSLSGKTPVIKNEITTTLEFEQEGPEKHACYTCLHQFDFDIMETVLRTEVLPIPSYEPCQDGIFDKCWRMGQCKCKG